MTHRQGIWEDKNGVFWAAWWDHAGRLIQARVYGDSDSERKQYAFKIVEEYRAKLAERIEQKHSLTPGQIDEMSQVASFPREVVADLIKSVCRAIAWREGIDFDEQATYPSTVKQLIARVEDRADLLNTKVKGVSKRDLYRILDDPKRISVRQEAVDTICCCFDFSMQDVIDDAIEWSNATGRWEGRGSEDSWPIGYLPTGKSPEICNDWPDCSLPKNKCQLCPEKKS